MSFLRTFWLFIFVFLLSISVFTSVQAATTEAGRKWLDAKASEPDVVSLPSGLLYKVIKSGPAGGKSPLVSTKCSCHYRGTLIDGSEFDSSYRRGQPSQFAPNQVIKGWTEAMQLMKEGDKWELYIPSELAYGDRGAGAQIKPGSALIFELEMIEVLGEGVVRDEL